MTAPTHEEPGDRALLNSRLTALDGLRGAAAIVVVFHHLSLTFRPFSDDYIVPGSEHPALGSLVWFLTSTPAELAIAGPQAVLVFFVLSGFVLALPVIRAANGYAWWNYYPRRIVRLSLPAAASVILAAILLRASAAGVGEPTSLWVQAFRFEEVTPRMILTAMDLLFGDTSLNNPLWSLRWEMAFSLLLPVFVALALLLRRWWLPAAAVCVALSGVGAAFQLGSLRFLPVFLIGTLIAVNHERLTSRLESSHRRRLIAWSGAVIGLLSLMALTAHWTAWGLLGTTRFQSAWLAIEVAGAGGLVAVAVFWLPARRLLAFRIFRGLGRISFSLYLVHVPVILAATAVFGTALPVVRTIVSLGVAFGIAVLFTRFVEMPAQRFANWVGSATSRIVEKRADRDVAESG